VELPDPFAKGVIDFMLETLNRSHLHANDWQRTGFLDTLSVQATQFDLSDDTIQKLVQSGKDGAAAYLKWFQDPNAKPAPVNRL